VTRAAIYTRISKDRDGTSESPERQEHLCRSLAESKGWEVVEVYADRDLSAYKRGVFRPGYESLQDAVRSRRVDAVVVWSTTRLARSVQEFSRLLNLLEEHDVSLASCRDPIDTSTPTGRAMTQLHGVFAELESATISSRVKDSRAYAARQGRIKVGGTRPFGYSRAGEIVPKEAAVVREMADRLLSGDSITALARDLNGRGIRTALGNEWTRQSVRCLVLSATVAGIRTYRGEEFQGDWEPILTPDEQLQIRASRPADTRTGRRTLLGGLVYCGRCEKKMSFTGSRNIYRCQPGPGTGTCGGISVQARHVEPYVVETVLAFLARATLRPLDHGDGARLAELESQLADDERALDDAANERYVLRTMDGARYESIRAVLQDRINTATESLEAARRQAEQTEVILPPGDREALDAWWSSPSRSIEDQRAVIRQSLCRIEVRPASRKGAPFHPDRIALHWNWSIFLAAAKADTTPEDEAQAEYDRLNREAEEELIAAAEAEYERLNREAELEFG
jgi:DNA invertase Pin-like site-specific DNA recombinase